MPQIWMQQAYRFGLRLNAAQTRACLSHAGAARTAYNWGITEIGVAIEAYNAEKQRIAQATPEGVTPAKPTTQVPGHFELCKAWTERKDNPHNKLSWVANNSSSTYQSALRDAAVAWKNCVNSKLGRRKGRRVGAPRYRSRRRTRPAFALNGGVSVPNEQRKDITGRTLAPNGRQIKLPKIGIVATYENTGKLRRLLAKPDVDCAACQGACISVDHDGVPIDCKQCAGTGQRADGKNCRTCAGVGHRKCPQCRGAGSTPAARCVSATISKDSRGRWWCSIIIERVRDVRDQPNKRQSGKPVGIDLSITGLTLSTGQHIPHPAAGTTGARKVARLNKKLARAHVGSRRRGRTQHQLARAHGRSANVRRDWISKTATDIIRNHDVIGVEGWNVSDMLAQAATYDDAPRWITRARNRAMTDAAPGALRWCLTSRAPWYGVTVTQTDRFDETGRTCSACGQAKTKPVPLHHEKYQCLHCGHNISRRINTAVLVKQHAINVASGSGETKNARGDAVSPASLTGRQVSLKREATTEQNVAEATASTEGKSGTIGTQGSIVYTQQRDGPSEQPKLF